MAGNRLGPRGVFLYTSDTGTEYRIETDASLGAASALPVAASGDGSPPPRRFSPRGVWCKSVAGDPTTRFVPCNVDFAAYATSTPTSVTIDGEQFTSTGRVGERLTFR